MEANNMESSPPEQDISEQIGAQATPESASPINSSRRTGTKELHVRVSIPNYQYLDELANRYGMRSLSAAVNFLIESQRECHRAPSLGRSVPAAKQDEAP
jgi:hypothetical protein